MEFRRQITSVLVAALLVSFVLVHEAVAQVRFRRPAAVRPSAPAQVAPSPTRAPDGNVSFKALLQKVPEDARLRFLESMKFVDGRVASMRVDEVKVSLGSSNYVALMKSCTCSGHEGYECKANNSNFWQCTAQQGYVCDTATCNTQNDKKDKAMAFGAGSTFYQGLSAPERKKFLESLDFVNGRLVSVYIGDAQQKLAGPEFDKTMRALGVQPADVKSRARDGLYTAGSPGGIRPQGPAPVRLQ
jgi:hypothetical protein